MPTSFRLEGAEQIASSSLAALVHLKRNMKTALGDAANDIAKSAKGEAPYDTGHLKGSIQAKEIDYRRAIITVGAPYALFVEKGRKGFSARSGRVLAFKVKGKMIFTRSVGPAKAQPFFEPALEEGMSEVEDRLEDAIIKTLSTIKGI